MAPGRKKEKPTVTEVVKEIKRCNRHVFSSENIIKIVLESLRSEAFLYLQSLNQSFSEHQ